MRDYAARDFSDKYDYALSKRILFGEYFGR